MCTETLSHIRGVWQRMQSKSPIYDLLLNKHDLVFVSAERGSFKANLTLTACHLNSRQTIHGATSAAIVDWAGGMAIATHGMEKTGASVDIHVSYLTTAGIGDVLQIEGVAHRVGRTLAYTSVTISKLINGEAGPIVAKGSHTKFLVQQEPFHENSKVQVADTSALTRSTLS